MLIQNLCVRRQFEETGHATTKGHKIAIKGGYIHQTFQGGYTFSPLGLRVLRNIERIIREEMNKIDGQEILMPVVAGADLWIESGRYNTVDVLAKFKGRGGTDYVLNPTHEEVVVDFVKTVLESYRQLPFMVYQIQTKFRDELRARAGLIRTREFIMKDGYSFHTSQEDLEKYYGRALDAYYKLFKRCGFKNFVHVESPSGDMGGSVAHEFQLVHESGEDTIYLCACGFNTNKESVGDNAKCPKCGAEMKQERGIEIGNIFQLGDKYSAAMNLTFADSAGVRAHPIMGCYGIGVGRILAGILEESADENGPVWNMETAPFAVHVIAIPDKDGQANAAAEKIYNDLLEAGIDTILDNRDARAGEKFADADLVAAPIRLIISAKTLADKIAEVKYRVNDKDTAKMKAAFAIGDCIKEVRSAIESLK
ncbi:MAG: His/Gly/Thr/Pro-type tRNA ligase C-terminal domain-containing protein [Alphaproteobacteria bacterium]|nr:His/Gly/Thr/Pro-type tRNA ligase C-terminal domain-containing protein [Alphaproteobacteria bacterium]MCL2758476.1 His/Gly/Thr/Pro-type tRNA ligase C-terminal domain-containing protein [Alphaproteobacteria bacterium]